MRLTRKRKYRSEFLEFIVMMVFCFVVGYCIKALLKSCPIILWSGIGIFSVYAVLLLVAMIILIKRKKQEIAQQVAIAKEHDTYFEEGMDEMDWVMEAFDIGLRVFQKLYGCFIVIGGVFFAACLVIACLPKEDTSVSLTKTELEEIVVQNHAKLLEDNTELQQSLKRTYYENANTEEQLKVLFGVLLTESAYLGIEAPALKVDTLADTLGGYYDVTINTIVINKKNISIEEKICTTLLHELYHAYQYTCVEQLEITGDLLWVKQLAQWKEELEHQENNVDTNEGMIQYYTQGIEESARKYAEERLPVYLYYMD